MMSLKISATANTDSSSASTESAEECCNSNYLKQLNGQDREVGQLVQEHNYSKPWTWKPETTYAKPTRTLFIPKAPGKSIDPDEEIDVENIEDACVQVPSVPEANDCERYAMELRSVRPTAKDETEDWESRVPRSGWTAEHLRLYTAVVRALHELQLARLALADRPDEAVQRRLAVDTAARRVRRAMASVTWDLRLTHWLHATLQEYIPTPLFAIYLEVLQTLRAKVPTLVDQMLSLSTYNRLGVPVSEELLQLLQKPWDPAAPSLSQHKPRKLPMDPVLVMVPSGIGSHIGHNSRRNKAWINQLNLLGRVSTVGTHSANLTGQSTVEIMLDQLLALTRAKIDELKTTMPGRPVILLGWNEGAAIACQAALMESVAAVVCLGFPISTLAGRRGQADDAILDIQCPIFFVIGQNSPTSRQADVEELRERLRVQSGLLVIGSADERLRISAAKKRSESLTQSMVDRCILDEVGDFLGSVLTQPSPPTLTPSAASPPAVKPASAVSSTPGSASKTDPDMPVLRRESMDSSSQECEPPEAKKSRIETPSPAPSSVSSNPTPTKVSYATKQESSLPATTSARGEDSATFSIASDSNINFGTAKRVYEGNQRILSSSAEKKGGGTPSSASVTARSSHVGGITVNIGSLASLAPIGPIRMGSTEQEQPTVRTAVRPSGVRVPSTPTSHAGITSLSSLLASSPKASSILLASNSAGQIKVLGGDEASTSQSRTRTLDLSRVTLLTSSSSSVGMSQSGGVVMVNTGQGATTLLHQPSRSGRQQLQTRPPKLPAGTTLTHRAVPKVKGDQGSTATTTTTIQVSSSSTSLLSSTSARPAPCLSPATILELPVIFAKDGDPEEFAGAAALTAPLPVTLSSDLGGSGSATLTSSPLPLTITSDVSVRVGSAETKPHNGSLAQ